MVAFSGSHLGNQDTGRIIDAREPGALGSCFGTFSQEIPGDGEEVGIKNRRLLSSRWSHRRGRRNISWGRVCWPFEGAAGGKAVSTTLR